MNVPRDYLRVSKLDSSLGSIFFRKKILENFRIFKFEIYLFNFLIRLNDERLMSAEV